MYRITTEGKTWIKANIDSLADRKYYSSTGVQHDIQLMDIFNSYALKKLIKT